MRSARRAITLGVCASLLGVAPAVAATRYASPTGGTTEPCEQGNPCSLNHAIEAAKAGDEVVVLAGTYPVAATLSNFAALNVHGQAGAAIPEIDYTAKGFGALLALGSGSTASRLFLVGTEPEQILIGGGGAYDDLLVEARAAKETLAQLPGGAVLRDSVLWSTAAVAEATGVSSTSFGTETLRNDTIELPGSGSVALQAGDFCFILKFEPPFSCEPGISSASSFDVANTILRGGLLDMRANGSSGYYGQIHISHSNYRPTKIEQVTPGEITDAGGNQTSVEPALNPDFSEQASSPTIDAGVAATEMGTLDPAGNARVLGAAPDIGAYEFVPPAPPPPPPPPPPAHASAAGAKAKGATVTETLGCQGNPGQTCKLTIVLTSTERLLGSRLLSVTARSKKHRRPRTVRVTVGALTKTLQAGQVTTVSVPLNAIGKRLLTSRHTLPLTATTSLLDAACRATTLGRSKLTLTTPHKHHRRK
jgi:hypothetical protein